MDNSDAEVRPANTGVIAECGGPRARHMSMTGIGLMAARHQGVECARGDIVSFIDDDELLAPSWFEGVRSCLGDPQVALVTGPFLPLFEASVPEWLEPLWVTGEYGRSLGYLTLLDGGEVERDIDPVMVWGGNLTIRKHVFTAVRGSHPDYLPSPWEAYQGDGEVGLTVKVGAAGYRARYSPACAVMHSVPGERLTLEYLQRRAWFIGLHLSFTDTRRRSGLGAAHGVPETPPPERRSLLRRVAGRAHASTLVGLARSRPQSEAESGPEGEAAEIRRRLAEARAEGYRWHQKKLESLPGLLDYVCRPDFFEENGNLPAGPPDPECGKEGSPSQAGA